MGGTRVAAKELVGQAARDIHVVLGYGKANAQKLALLAQLTTRVTPRVVVESIVSGHQIATPQRGSCAVDETHLGIQPLDGARR